MSDWARRSVVSAAALAVAGLLTVSNLILALVPGGNGWRWITLVGFMLALIIAASANLLAAIPAGRWYLLGMIFAWLGDWLGYEFTWKLVLFLICHVFYLLAFWPYRQQSWLGRPAMAPYVLLLLVGLIILVPNAGVLAVPVVFYAVALTLVALLATAAKGVGILGGALFLVSDLMLGMTRLVGEWPPPWGTMLVMGTYLPAQFLLLLSILRLTRSARAAVKPAR